MCAPMTERCRIMYEQNYTSSDLSPGTYMKGKVIDCWEEKYDTKQWINGAGERCEHIVIAERNTQ